MVQQKVSFPTVNGLCTVDDYTITVESDPFKLSRLDKWLKNPPAKSSNAIMTTLILLYVVWWPLAQLRLFGFENQILSTFGTWIYLIITFPLFFTMKYRVARLVHRNTIRKVEANPPTHDETFGSVKVTYRAKGGYTRTSCLRARRGNAAYAEMVAELTKAGVLPG